MFLFSSRDPIELMYLYMFTCFYNQTLYKSQAYTVESCKNFICMNSRRSLISLLVSEIYQFSQYQSHLKFSVFRIAYSRGAQTFGSPGHIDFFQRVAGWESILRFFLKKCSKLQSVDWYIAFLLTALYFVFDPNYMLVTKFLSYVQW